MEAAPENPPRLIRSLAYPAIDGLRFYAALVVFLEHLINGCVTEYFRMPIERYSYHAATFKVRALFYIADGNHGVEVFFIISGFLMARIVLSPGRPFHYGRFIAARLKRIYPAFLMALAVATLGDVFIFKWPFLPWDFAANLVFANAAPQLGIRPYNHVTWSLGYEFAFYLAVPVLVVMARRIDQRLAAILLLVLAVLLIPEPFARMHALFVGAVVGSIHDDDLKRFARAVPLYVLALLYVGCAVLKAFWYDRYPDFYVTTLYHVFLAVTAALFVKIVWDGNILNRLFSSRPLRALGTVSYSIYLYHAIICSVVLYHLTPTPPSLSGALCYAVISAAITLVFAFTSYALVERPYFSRRRLEIARKEVVA
jgi:peptidoglycan/LPS O-acetylase OafA/YrhL